MLSSTGLSVAGGLQTKVGLATVDKDYRAAPIRLARASARTSTWQATTYINSAISAAWPTTERPWTED